MKRAEELEVELESLRERLSKLSEVSLRINESLDFDTVLNQVVSNACDLTGARYGAMTLLQESGRYEKSFFLRIYAGGNQAVAGLAGRGGALQPIHQHSSIHEAPGHGQLCKVTRPLDWSDAIE